MFNRGKFFFTSFAMVALCSVVSAAELIYDSSESRSSYVFTEDFSLPQEMVQNSFILQVTSQQFLNQENKLKECLRTYGDKLTLEIDVQRGDGLVNEKGVLLFRTPYDRLFSLIIKNTTGDVTSIESYFLSGHEELTFLDLSSLSQVTSIGSYFLRNCSGLTSLDLSPLSHVTSIERGFLSDCSGLTSLDLSPLSHVTSIGSTFLFNCSGLTSLDLSPLSRVTSIESYFLRNCSGLTSLDLSPLSHVTSIGSDFLSDCCGLTSLDLSPLSHVTSIGSTFLFDCSGLTSLDLSPLSHVTSIESVFLSDCCGLTSLDLSPLSHVTSIGSHFLHGCSGLTSLDLSPLSHVTSIGSYFLYGCKGLTSLDLSPLNHVTSIGSAFLSGCKGLTFLDLSPLSHVTSIESYFLSDCCGLTSLELSHLSHVTSIGRYFLSGCRGLTSVTVSDQSSCTLVEAVVNFLRESNKPVQQQLGNELYQQYLCTYSTNLGKLLKIWNGPRIKLMNSKEMPDLPDMTGETVIDIFQETCVALQKTYAIQKDDHSIIEEAYLPAEKVENFPTLLTILKYCYGDNSVIVNWKMYEENLPQMKIAFKHIAAGFKQLIATHKGCLEAATHMGQLLDGFPYCQSRQAMVLNQVLVSMGRTNLDVDSRESVLWSLINNFKWEAFTQFVGDSGERTHEYARKFTVINNHFGLPVALQTFQEKISRLSEQEINQHLSDFLFGFFIKERLVDYLRQEIITRHGETVDACLDEVAKNPFAYQNLRTVLWGLCGHTGDPCVYFMGLSGFDPEDETWSYETTPLSKGEIEALLVNIGCLVAQDSEKMAI